MITCINQGPNGPSFSKLTATAYGSEVNFFIEGRNDKSVSVVLDRKNVVLLAKKLLDWSGEPPEPAPAVTGTL